MKKITTETWAIIIATIVFLFLLMSVANAQEATPQPQCAPTEAVIGLYESKGHTRRVTALLQTGNVMEIWETKEGYFAILIHSPSMTTCLVATGTHINVNPYNKPEL